ncbi:hypothetical protein ARMGADRAFT_1037743 [Armillaria gallica]|uniref:C3H1-type domain-containing protein n=1 Tax=Armillaria gallica TaxID=47427 RepID=A0A2H3CKF3_ARMGA|nr:hypothetical protein ARMGADRAFT_1037743 [Armillaria gallica]
MSYNIDYYHIGNGITCWYYNHNTCMQGINCEYSHAPDIRNREECLPSLPTRLLFLPPNLSNGAALAPPPTIHIPPTPFLAEPMKPPKSAACIKLDMKRKVQRSKRRRAEAIVRNRGFYSPYGRRKSEREKERAENFGFLRGEAEELACQAVKPWDDDAWDVMDALTSGF